MGRPAWANDEQWTWLKSQAMEYMKIKGKKSETAKFWPGFLEGWKEQWPMPALSDPVHNDGSGASTAAGTTDEADASGSAGDNDDTGDNDNQQSALTMKAKKPRKLLTVSVVRMVSLALEYLALTLA
jgi:hypothetical protein